MQKGQDVGIVLDDADDRYRDPVKQRCAKNVVLLEQRAELVCQHEDMHLFQATDQGKQRDVEKHGSPVEFAENLLEIRRIGALAEQFEEQYRQSAGPPGHRGPRSAVRTSLISLLDAALHPASLRPDAVDMPRSYAPLGEPLAQQP